MSEIPAESDAFFVLHRGFYTTFYTRQLTGMYVDVFTVEELIDQNQDSN